MLAFLPLLILSYLLGSVSSAVVVSKILSLPDPRYQGSNNPGATNMLRLGGKRAAALTLLGDMAKGFIPVWIVYAAAGEPVLVGMVWLATFFGHLYPVFFSFKGGKGIATFWGGLFGFAPIIALGWAIVWLLVAVLFRKSSLAALTSSLLVPVALYYQNPLYFLPSAMAVGFIFWRHRANIIRLYHGSEPSIGKK